MLYVENSLSKNERVVAAAYFHWIYTFGAIVWVITGILGAALIVWGAGSYYTLRAYDPEATLLDIAAGMDSVPLLRSFELFWQMPPMIRAFAFASIFIGLMIFASRMIVRATTEVAVTNRRLIYKRGLIARNVEELGVDRIEGVDFAQSILGRILGYGQVMAYGMGVGDVKLPRIIADPMRFRKAIEYAKSLAEDR